MRNKPHTVDGLKLDNLTYLELQRERARLLEKLSRGDGTQRDVKALEQTNSIMGELSKAAKLAADEIRKTSMAR